MVDPSSYLNDGEAKELAEQLATFLKSRTFEKHPHIALLGPKPQTQLIRTSKLLTAPGQSEEDELLSDKVEEKSSERIVPYVTGFRCLLKQKSPSPTARIKYSFYIRIAPPSFTASGSAAVIDINEGDQFRRVSILAELKESTVTVQLSIADENGATSFSDRHTSELEDGSTKLTIPDDQFAEAAPHLATSNLPFSLMRRFEEDRTGGGRRGRSNKSEVFYLSKDFAYVPSFAVGLSMKQQSEGLELLFRLTNDGGRLRKRENLASELPPEIERDFRRQASDADGKAWSLGRFLEVEGALELDGYDRGWIPTGRGMQGLHTINSVYQDVSGRITFRDYALDTEALPSVQESTLEPSQVILASLNNLASAGLFAITSDVRKEVASAVSQALSEMGVSHLYMFQEDGTRKILSSLGQKKVVVIAARAASGKTLAFVVPTVAYSAAANLSGELPGVKAMLFYPTKALCHDQADVVLELLWHTNTALRKAGRRRIVSVGILHGNTYSDYEILREMETAGPVLEKELRYKCPECGSRLLIEFRKESINVTSDADEAVYAETGTKLMGTVSCSGRDNPSCRLVRGSQDPDSAEMLEFLNKMLRPSRHSIYSSPPDLLIATPDMISLKLLRSPETQTIFGRSAFICTNCGTPAIQKRQRKCRRCKTQLPADMARFNHPAIVVFDEAHQLRGSFGAQVSFVISRLKAAVRRLNGLAEYDPLLVFSSATFSDPKSFLRGFLGTQNFQFELINAEPKHTSAHGQDQFNRMHLFVMPKGYSPNATLTKIVQEVFRYFVGHKGRYPNILVFANQLSITSELINEIETGLFDYLDENSLMKGKPEPIIDGHSTDWNKARVDVEDRFSKGLINVLVATRGLEVGVDFNRIDVLVMFGSPFYVSDYLQRIGRSARKHSALAVSIHLEKPVDFFFLRNFRLVSDITVRDEALKTEDSSVTRDNPVIYRRTLGRAILDYLCIQDDAPLYYSKIIKGGAAGVRDNLKALFMHLFDEATADRYLAAYFDRTDSPPARTETTLNDGLLAYVKEAVGSPPDTERITLDTAISFVDRIDKYAKDGTLGSIIMSKGFQKRFYIMQLRSSDSSVTITYDDMQEFKRTRDPDEYSRPRNLGLAVGHYAPGQISSYRGVAHIVTRVDANEQESSAIVDTLYKGEEED